MCDPETKLHLERIEAKISIVANDVGWLKKIVGAILIIVAAAAGIDIKGLI